MRAVGIAHAYRHFVGELPVIGIVERGGGIAQADPLEQHVLIQARKIGRVGLIGQRLRQLADMLAFAFILVAIGKRGEQGDGQY